MHIDMHARQLLCVTHVVNLNDSLDRDEKADVDSQQQSCPEEW